MSWFTGRSPQTLIVWGHKLWSTNIFLLFSHLVMKELSLACLLRGHTLETTHWSFSDIIYPDLKLCWSLWTRRLEHGAGGSVRARKHHIVCEERVWFPVNEFLIFSNSPLLHVVNILTGTRGALPSGVRASSQERACTPRECQDTPG